MVVLDVPTWLGRRETASSSLLLSSLALSDTTVYEPYVRALLGTGGRLPDRRGDVRVPAPHNNLNGSKDWKWLKPRPETGRDCLNYTDLTVLTVPN